VGNNFFERLENMTDLDRLHRVVLGENVGRGVGKTYANIHLLAGCVELNDNTNFFIVGSQQTIRCIKPMIVNVFEEHGIKIVRVASVGRECNLSVDYEGKVKFIRIMLNVDLETRLRGSRGNYIINDDTFLSKDMEAYIRFNGEM